MSDQQAPVTPVVETPATTPAVAQNTETKPENMIPQSRFNEIVQRAKEAEDKLKAIADAQAKADEAKLTEQQKYAELYEGEKRKAEKLDARLQQLMAEARKDKINRAIEAEARKLSFAEPADAFRFIDTSTIELDEAGNVKGADVLVKEVAKAKTYLLAQPTLTPGNGQSPKPAGKAGTAANEKEAQNRSRNFYQNAF